VTGPGRIGGNSGATVRFTFDGVEYRARPGDTLAAALLANGIGRVARSFKYHRPRGIMAAGVEEPNALVTVGEGGRTEPNTRATDVFVYDGLVARSQNRWPSLAFDVGAINGLLAPFLAAGFYYKTFFGPPRRWMLYERFIRKAAGLGPAPTEPDPDHYEHRSAFCDLLVVGSGAAGLSAALAAGKEGKRVMLVEQDRILGGRALADGGSPAADPDMLRAAGVRLLTRTTAAGLWDDNFMTLAERLAEPGEVPFPGGFTQRLWHVRAGQILLATGAFERPLTFAGNDRPGIMLSQAVRTYINRFSVLPGARVLIATNNDDAYATADAIAAAGGQVLAILDSRRQLSSVAKEASARFLIHADSTPISTKADAHHLKGVTARIGTGVVQFDADLLAVSGGFVPAVHLHSQAGGALAWREDIQAFVPGASRQAVVSVGSAAGEVDAIAPPDTVPLRLPKTSFIDFQNDVTAADIDLAWREGYRSVEHVKRYTTLGMATDQGKTSNMAALARLAGAAGVDIPQAGLTRFRAPFTPVTLGTVAGPDAGGHIAPSRRLALHDRHMALAATWVPLGYWHRPRAYPLAGESLQQAARREAIAVRTAAGIVDVSTLAKFIVAGPDAAAFLELVCATNITKLAIGRGRYTIMLREDGMVMDDGTVWRLADTRYLLTSSTGGADRMEAHLSYLRLVLGSGLRVAVIPQQEQLAGIALAGPQATAILTELIGEAPPAHMGLAHASLAGVPVLVLAASYSGERSFEIYPPGFAAGPVWDALETAVRAHGGYPYGLEALDWLRIEKGHVVIGAEAEGRTTADDLGMGKMLRKAGGFVGAQALSLAALSAPGRMQLVGLKAAEAIPEGAMLVVGDGAPVEGHVTSATSRVLGQGGIALALLAGGRSRLGETILASSPTRGRKVSVTVTEPMFHDPDGARYRD
jgi:glycine cleavage system aminomethyltransferase T/NADPH-dependent 2,4-dienoyl-CoA reductase/sulfur reductase-like enzyme